MKIQKSIEISALADIIWPFLTEPEKIIKWCFTIDNFRNTSEQSSGLGTPFSFEEKAAGQLMKLDFVVTEWVLNRSLAFSMTSGNVVKGYKQRYTIEAIPSGSRFTCFEDVELPYGFLGRIAGLFRRFVSGANLEVMLFKLKTLAEADGRAG